MGLVFFVFCLFPRPVLAAAEPARLEAEEVVFNYEARILIARGKAQLTYKDFSVRADQIEVEMDRDLLTARGEVDFTTKDGSFTATELVWDLRQEVGQAKALRGEFTAANTEEKIFFTGDSLTRRGEALYAEGLALTTCDREDPHYRFTAAAVEYYPGDRLVLRRVYYWEGRFRLFYLPYLALSLRERANYFSFPQFGYNETEGLFLKLAYNFFVGTAYAGSLLLDLTSRRGAGEGVRYAWSPAEGKEVWGLIYHLDLPDGTDGYRLEGGWSFPLGGLGFQGRLGLVDEPGTEGIRLHTYQLNLNLTGKAAGPQGSLQYRYFTGADRVVETLDLGLNGTWQPWAGASLRLQGRWYWNEDNLVGPVYKEGYEARFVQAFSAGTLTAFWRSQTGPGYRHAYLPDLKLEIPRFSLGRRAVFNLGLGYQYRIAETQQVYQEGRRLALDLSLRPATLLTRGPFSLQVTAWGKGRFYGGGEAIWGAAPELNLVVRGGPWEARAGLAWVLAEGKPPGLFSGDLLLPRANLGLQMSYSRGGWQGRVSTGYAFFSGVWQNITANLFWQGGSGDQLNFYTSYDPQTGLFGLTGFTLGWQPRKDWSFRMNTAYDPWTGGWRQLDLALSLRENLGDRFSLGLRTRYDFFRETWLEAGVNLDYRWHCRTVRLGYDWARQEVTLGIWINAFPEYTMGIAYGEGGLFFTPPVWP